MARVVAAIVADPMAPHSLEHLAAIAHFSPFHFHRLYRNILGETVMDTVRRIRLAHAAALLGTDRHSVTQVALEAGYDSPQAFSRAFHQYAGASPRDFRRKILEMTGEHTPDSTDETTFIPQVQLVGREPVRVQALRHYGPIATIPHTHRHLRQLVAQQPIDLWMGISYGDPEADGDFAYFAATTLKREGMIGGDVVPVDIPAGLYASYVLTGPYTQINAAINALYSLWLPSSGYEPDDRPMLELYRNNPEKVLPEALQTDLLIPLRPAQT